MRGLLMIGQFSPAAVTAASGSFIERVEYLMRVVLACKERGERFGSKPEKNFVVDLRELEMRVCRRGCLGAHVGPLRFSGSQNLRGQNSCGHGAPPTEGMTTAKEILHGCTLWMRVLRETGKPLISLTKSGAY